MLGVDPGKHTGLARAELWHDPDHQSSLLLSFRLRNLGLMTVELPKLPAALSSMIRTMPSPQAIAVEKFIVTMHTLQTQETDAIEAIGTVRTIMWAYGLPAQCLSLIQKPSDAKPLITNKQLTDLGLTRVMSGQSAHAKDALRHAVLWCSRYVRNMEQLWQPTSRTH